MQRGLEGAVVAITGGAQGIGKATAELMVGRGARVAIGDLDLESVTATAAEIGKAAVGLSLDVTDRGSFEEFLDTAESLLGPLDCVVNNAGVMIVGAFEDESPDSTRAMIDVNLLGVINGTQLAMARMKTRHRGRIINIASQAGKGGLAGGATYCATKAAVISFSEAVRTELKETGVGISWVLPGVVDTELSAGLPSIGLMDPLEPRDIAEAVADALENGGAEIWVPAVNQWLETPMRLLPRHLREKVLGLTGADRVLSDADPVRRRAYEDQASGRT